MTCKTKHGKQGYANGNLVLDNFDYNSLSKEQQAYYNTLDEKGQLNFRNEKGAIQPDKNQSKDESGLLDIVGLEDTIAGVASGIETMEDDVLRGIVEIISPSLADAFYSGSDEEKAIRDKRDALSLATGQQRSAQSAFVNGGSVSDNSDKKNKKNGKERDVGTLNVSAARERQLYGDPEGPKPLYTSDEVITGMLQEGYKPFPEERADNIQNSYQMSESDKKVYDAFETKDIQSYITDKLGLDLDDFGVDNVYGKETGEILSKYISQREDVEKIDPISPTGDSSLPKPNIQVQKNIDKILYQGPNTEIYQADPNVFGREGAEKSFTRSAERETLQYLTEVAGLDYESSKELMKTEKGRKDLINKFNKSQGFSENLVQAYAQQGTFPTYKKGKLQGQERIYDDEGNLILKDIESLNYREGGTVKGEGTGKSDSIDADLNLGDFLIPTDTPVSNNALKSLMKILDLDHIADTTKGSKDVDISNGEKIIPRDKVGDANDLLKRMGYKNGLQDAAPNAEYDFLSYQNII